MTNVLDITMWSDAVGRYTINSDKTLTFDIKIAFEKKSALPAVNWTTLVRSFLPLLNNYHQTP